MAVLEMEEGRMQVCRDGAPIYDIVLEDSFDRLPEEMERLGSQGRKLCIVTDSNVAPLYLEAVEKLLSGCFSQVTSYVFPAGEEHKNLDTVKRVYEHLIQNRFDRKDWLAALGGGVTGDLCIPWFFSTSSRRKYLPKKHSAGHQILTGRIISKERK